MKITNSEQQMLKYTIYDTMIHFELTIDKNVAYSKLKIKNNTYQTNIHPLSDFIGIK